MLVNQAVTLIDMAMYLIHDGCVVDIGTYTIHNLLGIPILLTLFAGKVGKQLV